MIQLRILILLKMNMSIRYVILYELEKTILHMTLNLSPHGKGAVFVQLKKLVKFRKTYYCRMDMFFLTAISLYASDKL